MAAGALSIAVSAALVARVFVPEPPVRAAASAPILVAGVPAVPSGDARSLAVDLARAYLRERVTLVVSGERRELSRAALGAAVDAEHLAALLRDAADARSALRRLHAQLHGTAPLDLPMPTTLDDERAARLLIRVKDDFDRLPADARIDNETGAVVPEVIGRRLDVHKTLDVIAAALHSGARVIRAVVETRAPHRTHEALAHIDASVVLGEFETRYDVSAKSSDRSFNLHVAADKVDGLVVMPGETFDFNDAVGERTEANGFRLAHVIADGELSDGVGGGTCQIAGTLHAAVFFSGLPIVTRQPHTRPSAYLKMGLDATVSYPDLDFRFRNDLAFPVVIGFRVGWGTVRAEIRGARRTRLVTFVRRIDQALPFEERVDADPSLPSGVRVLSQRGIPGFRLRRWRIVRDVGSNQAIRQRMTDAYPPTTQIWRAGTGPAAAPGFVPPAGDQHPEYVADEYLVMTQGPGVDGTQESKRGGRYGTSGWTDREHMTHRRAAGAPR